MNSKTMLMDGLADAVGFVGGSLISFWVGRFFGFDIFDAGYSNTTIAGIVMVGIGAAWVCRLRAAYALRNAQNRQKPMKWKVDSGFC